MPSPCGSHLRRPRPPPRRADPAYPVLVRLLAARIRPASSSTPSPPDIASAVLVHPSPSVPASTVLADALTGRSASDVLVTGLITGSRACMVLSRAEVPLALIRQVVTLFINLAGLSWQWACTAMGCVLLALHTL